MVARARDPVVVDGGENDAVRECDVVEAMVGGSQRMRVVDATDTDSGWWWWCSPWSEEECAANDGEEDEEEDDWTVVVGLNMAMEGGDDDDDDEEDYMHLEDENGDMDRDDLPHHHQYYRKPPRPPLLLGNNCLACAPTEIRSFVVLVLVLLRPRIGHRPWKDLDPIVVAAHSLGTDGDCLLDVGNTNNNRLEEDDWHWHTDELVLLHTGWDDEDGGEWATREPTNSHHDHCRFDLERALAIDFAVARNLP